MPGPDCWPAMRWRAGKPKPWVKTSLGRVRAVTDYLDKAGLLDDLEKLGFFVVGYGCTTCIGSGPLPGGSGIAENDLAVAAVLSGNRNFEAASRRSQSTTSPAAPGGGYALAGTVDIDSPAIRSAMRPTRRR